MEFLFTAAHAAIGDPGAVDFNPGRIAALAAALAGIFFAYKCARMRWEKRQRFRRGLRDGTVKFAVMSHNADGEALWEPIGGGMLVEMGRRLQVRVYKSPETAAMRARELAKRSECEIAQVVCWDKRRRRYITWGEFNQRR